jgi:hypothetical protein
MKDLDDQGVLAGINISIPHGTRQEKTYAHSRSESNPSISPVRH